MNDMEDDAHACADGVLVRAIGSSNPSAAAGENVNVDCDVLLGLLLYSRGSVGAGVRRKLGREGEEGPIWTTALPDDDAAARSTESLNSGL